MANHSASSPHIHTPITPESQARKPAKKRPIPWHVRRAVVERDKGTCQYCGVSGKVAWSGAWVWIQHEFDHVHPETLGGEATVENIVIACRSCNRAKGAKTLGRAFRCNG